MDPSQPNVMEASEPASLKKAALKALAPTTTEIKTVFTTGEVAEICKVSQQTVIRCFDSGRLKGFRVPGSKFRRIPRDSLIAFMKANNIPLENLQSGKTRVLIVDDEPGVVDLLRDILTRDGRYEVFTASNGYDAGLMTAQVRPAIVLLDYMLPDINGSVVCQRIRSDPEMAGVKIIIISGVVRQTEIDQLMTAGANAFLKKPFDIAQLFQAMADVTA